MVARPFPANAGADLHQEGIGVRWRNRESARGLQAGRREGADFSPPDQFQRRGRQQAVRQMAGRQHLVRSEHGKAGHTKGQGATGTGAQKKTKGKRHGRASRNCGKESTPKRFPSQSKSRRFPGKKEECLHGAEDGPFMRRLEMKRSLPGPDRGAA